MTTTPHAVDAQPVEDATRLTTQPLAPVQPARVTLLGPLRHAWRQLTSMPVQVSEPLSSAAIAEGVECLASRRRSAGGTHPGDATGVTSPPAHRGRADQASGGLGVGPTARDRSAAR